MLSWIKKHPILFTIAVFLFTPAALNYSGMCIPEGRWLSDEERIRIEAEKMVAWRDIDIYDEKTKVRTFYKRVGDETVEEFMKNNPECCSVGGRVAEVSPPEFLERIFGKQFGTPITMRFLYKYQSGNTLQSKFINNDGYQDNCGQVSSIY